MRHSPAWLVTVVAAGFVLLELALNVAWTLGFWYIFALYFTFRAPPPTGLQMAAGVLAWAGVQGAVVLGFWRFAVLAIGVRRRAPATVATVGLIASVIWSVLWWNGLP